MNQLIESYRDYSKIEYLRKKLSQQGSKVIDGDIPTNQWGKNVLGPSYHKTLLMTKGLESISEDADDFTAMGGWCALRTKDVNNLRRGYIVNSENGKKYKYKSVQDVADWIKKTISIDQVIESVGIFNGKKYLIISETKLWSDKVIFILEKYFQRGLTQNEKSQIYYAIKESEDMKFHATKAYINTFSPITSPKITRIFDYEIFDELTEGRDNLFKKFNIEYDELIFPVIQRIKERHPNKNIKQEKQIIEKYARDYSMSWFFFTGAYFNILKEKEFVDTNYGLLINPWIYALGEEFEAERVFNSQVFTGNNSYLNPNGINSKLAYVAVNQSETFTFKVLKTVNSIDLMPNTQNYKNYIDNLYKEIRKIDTNIFNNNIALDAYNFTQSINSQIHLEKIASTSKDFSVKRNSVDLNKPEKRRKFINDLRKEDLTKIKSASEELLNIMEDFFSKALNI